MNAFEDEFEEGFHVHHGPVLKNLQALMDQASLLTDEQFRHHVNERKHDFADWAAHADVGEDAVQLIRSAKTKDELISALKQVRDGTHAPIEDEEFERKHEEYTEKDEAIQERFDEMATRMQKAIADEIPEEIQKREDGLRDRYDELKLKMSELRKEGKDMLIVALELKRFKGKIMLAHATREPKDFDAAKEVLDIAEKEMGVAEEQEEMDIKREVLQMAGEGLKTDDIGNEDER